MMGRGLQQHRDPPVLSFTPVVARVARGGWVWAPELATEPGSSAPWLGDSPVHAVTPQQAAWTRMGRTGWQGLCWVAPAQQQGSADGGGVQMVSGHGVKWTIELGWETCFIPITVT